MNFGPIDTDSGPSKGVNILLIVLAIILILILTIYSKYGSWLISERQNDRDSQLTKASIYILKYYFDNGSYPTGDCLRDIENLLVPVYTGSLPQDPLLDRVVYGTKIGGCEPGDFAYKNLKYNGNENQGFILLARPEIGGYRGDFIVGGSDVVNFVSDCGKDEYCYSNENSYGLSVPRDAKVYSFDDVSEIEKAFCEKVEFGKGKETKFCNSTVYKAIVKEENVVQVRMFGSGLDIHKGINGRE